jgi:hypothetical protein
MQHNQKYLVSLPDVKSRIIPFPIPAFVSPEKSVISDKIPHNICA